MLSLASRRNTCHSLVKQNRLLSTVAPRVVFENEHALFIDKPPGLSHHSSADEDGVLTCMRNMQKNGEMYKGELFSVHRLDKHTSGLLMLAKSKLAAAHFVNQFESRKVVKYYIAVANQKPKKKMGLISGDMAPSRRSQQKLLRSQEDPAKTRFISRSFDCDLDSEEENEFAKYSSADAPSLRLFLLRPLTGKKHQIRVMMKSLRAPVMGDPLYSTKDKLEKTASDRCYLHACALQVNMPSDENQEGELVQIILKPEKGKVFSSSGFEACWNSWVLPNMVLEDGSMESDQDQSLSDHYGYRKHMTLIRRSSPITFC